MLAIPRDILEKFPVRKSKKQKQVFRDAVQSYVTELGYECTVEKGSFGSRNLVIGDPENAKYLVTAHYDTCAKMLIPNLITPCNLWLFLGYQLIICLYLFCGALLIGALFSFSLGLICVILGDPFAEAMVISFTLSLVFGIYIGLPVAAVLLICGPANKHNANDNTSGVVTLLEIARTLPVNQRHKVCFVLFDQEELGLLGSSFYRSRHRKASNTQMVLNLDCVGDGDHLRMFPTKRLKQDKRRLSSLYRACGYFGKKDLLVHEKRFSIYPSDQMNFPYGVGICALRKKRKTLYLTRIHTKKDTVLEETNVNILRAALTTFICCDEVN